MRAAGLGARTLAAALVLLGVVSIIGCGSSGVTERELNEAHHSGERIGFAKGREGASQRVEIAHRAGYQEGVEDGESFNEAVEAISGEEGLPPGAAHPPGPTAAEEEGTINPTPEKEKGEDSYEFEPEDIERAEGAPSAVQEYCAGAVSEAQEVGCLSHVNESEVP